MSVPTNQAWPLRLQAMRNAVARFTHPIDALEIGTWFGEGSTQIWLHSLPRGSSLTLIDPWRPYSSAADLADEDWDYAGMDRQAIKGYFSTILEVWKFETEHPGRLRISILRGDSEALCQQMRDGLFDFIYIDGDHKYESVRTNIADAKRLAKDDALICGDDLEFLPNERLLAVARQHPDRDYLREPHNFHPGVLAAVHDELGNVSMSDGFWWIFKRNGNFTRDES